MPGQEIRQVQHDTATFTANAKSTVDIARGMILRELAFRYTGTLAGIGAGANNTLANANRGGEWGMVRQIDLIANGNDIIRSLSGTELFMFNRAVYGFNPKTVPQAGGPSLGDATSTGWSWDQILILPLWQPPVSHTPLDTALDTSRLSNLRVEVTWGAGASDITSAAGAAVATGGAAIAVKSRQSFFTDPKQAAAAKFGYSRLFRIVAQPTALNNAFRVELPVGPMYRGCLINVSNAAGAIDQLSVGDTTARVTNVILRSGPTVLRDVDWNTLREWEFARRGIGSNRDNITFNTATNVPALTSATLAHIPPTRSTNGANEAWVWWDFTDDGYLTEAVDSLGLSTLTFEFNVAAACTITILPMQVVPAKRL